jgi:hypothetical protein
VDAQPETPRAHLALYGVHLAAENPPGALQEAARIRELLPAPLRGYASFLEARARFSAGDAPAAGRAVREGLAQLRPDEPGVGLVGTPALQDVLSGANVLAYLGDIGGAAQVIAFADTVRRTMLAPESAPQQAPSGREETWEWARQARVRWLTKCSLLNRRHAPNGSSLTPPPHHQGGDQWHSLFQLL